MSNIAIAPSILSADFCNLERDLKAIANADLVHVDVMDHHFVPNLTLGEPIVGRICQVTDLPVDVHLMIEDPDRWAPEYAKLGAASVSFHMGATHAPVRLARQLREMGCKACFAVLHFIRGNLMDKDYELLPVPDVPEEALSALVEFLMLDCCQGHPEVCAPAQKGSACAC